MQLFTVKFHGDYAHGKGKVIFLTNISLEVNINTVYILFGRQFINPIEEACI